MVTRPDLVQRVLTERTTFENYSGDEVLAPLIGPSGLILLTGERHLRRRKLLLPPVSRREARALERRDRRDRRPRDRSPPARAATGNPPDDGADHRRGHLPGRLRRRGPRQARPPVRCDRTLEQPPLRGPAAGSAAAHRPRPALAVGRAAALARRDAHAARRRDRRRPRQAGRRRPVDDARRHRRGRQPRLHPRRAARRAAHAAVRRTRHDRQRARLELCVLGRPSGGLAAARGRGGYGRHGVHRRDRQGDAAAAPIGRRRGALRPERYRTRRPPIPAGARLATITVSGYDADSFHDPGAFKPERWLESEQPSNYASTPFGGGVHRCIGASLAGLESRIVLQRLARSAQRLTPAPGRRDGHTSYSAVLVPSRGGRVIVGSRRTKIERLPSDHE